QAPARPRSGDDPPRASEGRDLPVCAPEGGDRRTSSEGPRRGHRPQLEEDQEPVHRPTPDETELLQPIVRRFPQGWKRGQEPRIDDYLAEAGPHRAALLVRLVEEDMEHRLKAGQSHEVELYLEHYPELGDDQAAGLIALDYQLRRRRGNPVTVKEYL